MGVRTINIRSRVSHSFSNGGISGLEGGVGVGSEVGDRALEEGDNNEIV